MTRNKCRIRLMDVSGREYSGNNSMSCLSAFSVLPHQYVQTCLMTFHCCQNNFMRHWCDKQENNPWYGMEHSSTNVSLFQPEPYCPWPPFRGFIRPPISDRCLMTPLTWRIIITELFLHNLSQHPRLILSQGPLCKTDPRRRTNTRDDLSKESFLEDASRCQILGGWFNSLSTKWRLIETLVFNRSFLCPAVISTLHSTLSDKGNFAN